MNVLDRWYLGFRLRMERFREDFCSDERGISGIVAAIILLLIVIVLAAIFWDKISQLVKDWWSAITKQSDTLKDKVKP